MNMVGSVEANNGSPLWEAKRLYTKSEDQAPHLSGRRLATYTGAALLSAVIGSGIYAAEQGYLGYRIYNDDVSKGIAVFGGKNLDKGCAAGFSTGEIVISRPKQVPQQVKWRPVVRCIF